MSNLERCYPKIVDGERPRGLNWDVPPFEACHHTESGMLGILKRHAVQPEKCSVFPVPCRCHLDSMSVIGVRAETLAHADVLIAKLAVKIGWDSANYEAAKAEADRVSPRTHRAEADGRRLAVLWRMISN